MTRFFVTSFALTTLLLGISSFAYEVKEAATPFSSSTNLATVALCNFTRSLSLGVSGAEVPCLQRFLNQSGFVVALEGAGSPGNESTYFGAKTKAAVIRWQSSQGLPATGLFGPLSRAAYAKLSAVPMSPTSSSPSPSPRISVVPSPTPLSTPAPAVSARLPVVTSVVPNRVRKGETVTINGENFSLTNNTVILGDGPLSVRFENLASFDGKTIRFTYQPPKVKTMTEAEVRTLPKEIVEKIEAPIKAVGKTLADGLTPYQGIHSEGELKRFLEQNGRSFEEMYHYFWVRVENENGSKLSKGPLLYGLRHFSFESADATSKPLAALGNTLDTFFKKIFPKAHAQLYGGGYTSGIIMACTCNTGTLTFQLDYTGGGTGLYYFLPGFLPLAGSGLVAGPWLGGYTQSAGICMIGVTPWCVELTANLPTLPVGYAF